MFRGKQYIYEIYKTGSFSAAAKNLYISQPALSNSVHRIEERIGSPLFDRSTSPIQLTDIGERYIDTCEKIMSAEEEFSHFLADEQNMKTGEITVGSNAMYISYLLPSLLSAFKVRHPAVELYIVEGTISSLQDQLTSGDIDLILGMRDIASPQFESSPYHDEHVILAVPADWTINRELMRWQQSPDNIISGRYLLKQFPSVPLERFSDSPFILLPQDNDFHALALELCRNVGFVPHIALTLDQQLTAYNVAGEGLCATFISDTLVRYAPADGRIIYYKLDPDLTRREVSFYYKKNRYIPRAMREFLAMAQTQA
ncbi:DNA-binding transcriptional regulator, LysR family [[Clostridium] aminophilum]|uniref:DNA-binding transcriptional regulator, LysR family n=1 Tax=[Clostridium] aminophilum TaxID=1526 RepID=A0A1I0GGL6_9FIRM|nr:LysR family transcriptional regulator [[Clostridium] aminophilum]SET70258.1 DNA-binding transcriptional regulator, LysR family [[Clostridium] aminophilum]